MNDNKAGTDSNNALPNSARSSRRTVSAPKTIKTVGELLHLSYANLASVDAAESRGLRMRDRLCWMIRAKLYKGLRSGSMTPSTLFADVRAVQTGLCTYCGAIPPPKLHGDHLIPRHRGGLESGDNLVWACRSCNSSKGSRDLLEWYSWKNEFPSVVLMRRYLKLSLAEAHARDIMNVGLSDQPIVTFSIDFIPVTYPDPGASFGLTRRTHAPWADRARASPSEAGIRRQA